jgi:hypothetical protein
MSFQITYDTKGEALGVFIPIEQWQAITKKHRDLAKLEKNLYAEPSKEEIIKGTQQGMKEAQLHLKGKLKLKATSRLLKELRETK